MLDKQIEAQNWMYAERGYEFARLAIAETEDETGYWIPPWADLADETRRSIVARWAGRVREA